MNLVFIFICCLFAAVSGLKKNGVCENVKNAEPMTSFNLTAYSGLWYEISKYEDGGACATVSYTPTKDPVQIINITTTITLLSTRINLTTLDGTAEQPVANVGKLIGHFKPGGVKTDIEYRILKTDYKNYAVLYSCKNDSSNTSHEESAWVLSRDRVLGADSKKAVEEALKGTAINATLLKKTEQDEYICTFQTACDKTLAPVQENFDAAAYLGEWYEISRYEQAFETDGDCVTAEYSSATTGGLLVKNTMKDLGKQQTSSILGKAVLAYEKGDPLLGLLRVSFNVNGVDTNAEYRVFTTDYKSYSVVYSCENVNGKVSYRSAWVLSRNRVLSSDSKKAVEEALKASPINETLLKTTEQDEYICTSPTACDKKLAPVQENFDAAAYLGEWYEISRYEQAFQTDGDCVTAKYSLAETGGLLVENTMKNLKDKKTSSILGTAVLAYEKGDPLLGLLKVSFNVSGVQTNSEYRVLSTDYKSYSVVYSCQNVNGNVSYGAAWILSRTRSLKNAEEVYKIVDASNIERDDMRITEQDEKKCNGATASQIASIFLVITALVTGFIVKE